jgi:hypothetical protein
MNPVPDVYGVPLLYIIYRNSKELNDSFNHKFNDGRPWNKRVRVSGASLRFAPWIDR